jgi:4-hydroxythreonine-4-phosphate dehydrogenase
VLALVPGEPAGIGPELCVRLAQRQRHCRLVALADPAILRRAAQQLGMPLKLCPPDADTGPGELAVETIAHPVIPPFGRPDPANARSVIAALEAGGQGCLEGRYQGLVTGPVHKAAINAGGIAYSGTTELLAEQAGADVVMMLATTTARAGHGPLRVALATTHLALRAVPDAITEHGLTRTLRILDSALRRDFGLPAPRIAVLGLNPHAGEAGLLGREEIEVIEPVLERLRSIGLNLIGPLPADTAFLPNLLNGFDAVLAMYHDQGLPVLKHVGFEHAVNITLGLPYPRVAVDHGTALELAGSGTADPSSLIAAIELCTELARHRGPAA